jgi:hypothetical protein
MRDIQIDCIRARMGVQSPSRNSKPPPESDQQAPLPLPTDEVRVKAIHALGLLALLIGATFAGPLSTAELEPDTGDQLNLLMYDFEQPLTGREDPKLLAATASKVLELARKQFAERPRSDLTCLGIGYAGADPSAALLQLTRQSIPKVRPVSDCTRRETMTTRVSNRPDSLLRLDSIERRGRDAARIHTSLFLGSMSGAGWRCEAVRMGAQWVIGSCRLMWTL